MTEAQFQQRITDLCDWLGLLWFHDTDARRNPSGFPDLVIVGPHGVVYIELKAERGRVRPEQQTWHDALKRAGAEAYIFRPGDWPFISDRLHVLAWPSPSSSPRGNRMTTLCFIDCETTGLDPRIHQPYEVCVWREDWDEPRTLYPGHTLEFAEQTALKVGGYFDRDFRPAPDNSLSTPGSLAKHLRGVTLVGSNPAFDAAMLTRVIGTAVWHHRLINVAEGAMWLFNWDRPKGLADVTAALRERGHEIPEPDHTAEGDVRTTRAVYYALREEREGLA